MSCSKTNFEIQAREELLGEGGVFELVSEEVLGQEFDVFKNRFRSLQELVAYTEKFKDNEFLVMGSRRYTFRNFIDLVAATAKTLTEDFDIKQGDRVAIFAANSPEWVVTFFAIVCTGAIATAYNSRWTTVETQYGISHSKPKLIVGDTSRLEQIKDLNIESLTGANTGTVNTVNMEKQFHNITADAPEVALPTNELVEDDPCLILYTSGTTGKPKGATISHRGLVGFIQTQLCGVALRIKIAELNGIDAPKRTSQGISLGTSPLFHISGLHGTVLMNIITGGKIIYLPSRFDPTTVLETIEKEGITQFSALGSSGHQIASHPDISKYDLSSVQSVGFGGAPASPSIQQLMRETFPNAARAIGMGYGSSETCAVVSNIGGAELESRPESCGKLGVGMEVEIRDEGSNVLPNGKQGEIHCRSAYAMLGYWEDEAATAGTIKEGRWLATGDIGCIDEEGYLYINSRARDMILRNAENIYPIEIEYRLDAHPDIAESAVFGVDHPEMGQEVMAVVVLEGPNSKIEPSQIAEYLSEFLTSYKIPTKWKISQNPLPRNPAGKILKLDLHKSL